MLKQACSVKFVRPFFCSLFAMGAGASGGLTEALTAASQGEVQDVLKTLSEEQKAKLLAAMKPETKEAKYKIVFVRHGESEWNLKNLFCGWYDANLSEKGVSEAKAGGKGIKDAGLKFDQAYSSMLTRANKTLDFILEESGQKDSCNIEKTWRLNERHYGDLTGANKKEAVEKFGADQVLVWRRSFDTPPPEMKEDNAFYKEIREDARYKDQLTDAEFPKCESLELTIKRTLPFWNDTIVPAMKAGKKVIVAAHGNSLRGLVCHLDNISKDDITELNLPTGIPFVYELDEDFKPVVSMKFLGDEATVAAAIEAVKNQTGAAKK